MQTDRRTVLTAGTMLTTMFASGAQAQQALHEPSLEDETPLRQPLCVCHLPVPGRNLFRELSGI